MIFQNTTSLTRKTGLPAIISKVKKGSLSFLFYLFLLNNAFSSVASAGFIFPANTRLSCFRRKAASKRCFSSSVCGSIVGTSTGRPVSSTATKV